MGSVTQAKQAWQEVVARKRLIQADTLSKFVPQECGPQVLAGSKSFIRGQDLVASLASSAVSCEALMRLYIQRMCAVHNQTNCITEPCFDESLIRAGELDRRLASQHGLVGPLHGMPITLKDQFNVEGHDTTLGYVARAFSPASADAALVRMLRDLGAVIMAKTNLPQSIMWCETENPLWGLTTNPCDPEFTPGGSTGGEAVLIARGASVLGFGTDIGGSIRIPSHMMGIYGLKPSSSRLPYEGVPVSTEGQEHVPSSVGPMASSLDTIFLSMKSLADSKPWEYDARCVPMPWRQELYDETLGRPLVFGVLADDGVARPHPPLSRVLQHAVDVLQSAGHEVVQWNNDLHAECVELMDEFYTADGGEDVRKAVEMGGEPFIPHVHRLINRGKAISVFEYWQLNRRKWKLQQDYLDKWHSMRSRDGRPVDAILMPPMPHTAVPHGQTKWVGYTKVWNVLDYSALVIPGGRCSEADLEAPWHFDARGGVDEWSLRLWKEEGARMAALKFPVGLQLVCRKLEEEKLLGIGKILDDLLSADNE